MQRREFLHTLAVGAGVVALSPRSLFAQAPSPGDGKADWIFEGGLIYTVEPAQPRAEAVAVRGNRIVFVGSAKDVDAWQGLQTRTVNLAGGMLLPGFIDGHNHFVAGAATKRGVNLSGSKDTKAMLQHIRD